MKPFKFQSVLSLTLASFLLASCGPSGGGPGGGGVPVVAFHVENMPIREKISIVGNLAANEQVQIQSEIDGKVEEIHFEEGQTVKKDDILMLIDHKKLEAALAEAEANLKLARTSKQRYEKLIEQKAVSEQEYEEAIATLEAGEAARQQAHENLIDATVRAPFDGIVGARHVSVGQFITKGTMLTSVVDPDPIKAEFRIPERFIGRVQMGQEIQVRVSAWPEHQFSGSVYFISPQVDESTRTVLMKARIPNEDGRLRPGMFANLELVVEIRESALVVPELSVIFESDNTYLFVIGENNMVERREVATGVRMPGLVEITKNLQAGEKVVTEGIQKLGPGVPVQARMQENPLTGIESRQESARNVLPTIRTGE